MGDTGWARERRENRRLHPEAGAKSGELGYSPRRVRETKPPEGMASASRRTAEAPTTLTQDLLPLQRTSFVGRERELRQVRELLLDPGVRLLTLTGAGGSGKTRVALEAAKLSYDEVRSRELSVS